MSRVAVLCLDGFEISLARRMMDAGELPELASLRDRSSAWLLDHGRAEEAGLVWEHFLTGEGPEELGRFSAIEFDPRRYTCWQEGARFPGFLQHLGEETLVFDVPFLDLASSPRVQGVSGWGAHNPGVERDARPRSLLDELPAYPAAGWLYRAPWSSPASCEEMGGRLVEALRVRRQATTKMMCEAAPGWRVFLTASCELHAATEGLWHGIDPAHPLHHHPSAAAARCSLEQVYRAVDELVGAVVEEAGPGASVLVFNMSGMGPNTDDLPSMVLLPELLYRASFGRPLLRVPPAWSAAPGPAPLPAEVPWDQAVRACMDPPPPRGWQALMPRGRLGRIIRRHRRRPWSRDPRRPELRWMPALHYQPAWRHMEAFALPSFLGGRIRLNLKGREAAGRVSASGFDAACDRLEVCLRALRDPATGEPVVDGIRRPTAADPMGAPPTLEDLRVTWRGMTAAFEHPTLGLVGPVPYNRTGGHTGPHGFALIAGPEVPASRGWPLRSSFQVTPTVEQLVTGCPVSDSLLASPAVSPSLARPSGVPAGRWAGVGPRSALEPAPRRA